MTTNTKNSLHIFAPNAKILATLTLLWVFALNGFATTYYSRATGNWNSTATWSLTNGGGAAPSFPVAGDDVIITGNLVKTITVNTNSACQSITFQEPQGDDNLLTISSGFTLTVSGAIVLPASTTQASSELNVNGGILNAGSVSIAGGTNKGRYSLLSVSTGTINITGDLTFTGSAAQSDFSFTGAGTLNIGGTLGAGGTFSSFTGSTVNFNGTSAQTIPNSYVYSNVKINNAAGVSLAAPITLMNLTIGDVTSNSIFRDAGNAISISTGTNTLTMSNAGKFVIGNGAATTMPGFDTFTLAAATTIEYASTAPQTVFDIPTNYKNLTLSGNSTKTFTGVAVDGVLSIEGTTSAGNPITYGAASTLQYKLSTSRSTNSNELPTPFPGSGGIVVDMGANTITLHQNTTNNGNLNVLSGTLNLSTFTLNRSSAGGTFSIASGAQLQIGGTNTLPSNYSTHAVDCNSIINYSGSNQTVANLNSGQTYGHLSLNGSGTKTLQAGTSTICGNLSISATSTTAVTGLTIGGNMDIGASATFNAGAFTHIVRGNWTKTGTFTDTGSTIQFDGSSAQSIGTSNFNHLTFTSAGVKTATGALAINGNLTITSNFTHGDGLTHTVAGNYTNNGTYTPGTGTMSFTGTSPQAITGTSTLNFNNLIINGSGLKTLGVATSVTNNLTLTSGLLAIGNYDLTVGVASDGSSSSYVKTDGTGRIVIQTANLETKSFPVGVNYYNLMKIKYYGTNTDTWRVKVTDGDITTANDYTKAGKVRWDISKDLATQDSVLVTYYYDYANQKGSNLDYTVAPKLSYFSGTIWTYIVATTANATLFEGSGKLAGGPGYENGYITFGTDNAFSASKLVIASINPVNPLQGIASSVKVQSMNSQNYLTRIRQQGATTFDLSAQNTTLSVSGDLSGSIPFNAYETTLTNVIFETINTDNTATLTATRTAGENVTAGVSSTFNVLAGVIYEPTQSGNWSTVLWRNTSDGGATWSTPATISDFAFPQPPLIRIPAGITSTVDVTTSMYKMIILGNLTLATGSQLTLNHTFEGGIDIEVRGTFTNDGGTFINSNENPGYQIHFIGGNYIHNKAGDKVPVADWNSDGGERSSCTVNASGVAGLNQSFQDFTLQSGNQTLDGNMVVNNVFTLTAGRITTGATYKVTVASSGSIASNPSGYIDGKLVRQLGETADIVFFPVGEGSSYAPVAVDFNGYSGTINSGSITVTTTAAQPALASGLSQTKYINRKWTITNELSGTFTNFGLSFTFAEGDKVGTPTVSNLVIRKLNAGTWSLIPTIPPTGNTVSATGLTSFSDFYIGEDDCSSTNAIWFGSESTDWNSAANWCGGAVPVSTQDVYIPGGITNYPIVGAAGAIAKNLTIASGASLTMSGSYLLELKGDWNNSGTFTCSNCTIKFSGTATQTIYGTNHFENVIINNAAGVVSAGDLTVDDVLYLQSANPTSSTGSLHMGTNTLFMGASAQITGVGDVTGSINRTTFVTGVNYTYGNANTTLYFPVVAGQVLPTSFTVKVSLGTAPAWLPNGVRRYYDIASVGGVGNKAQINYQYLQSEVPGALDETTLSVWSKFGSNDPVDGGWNDYDVDLNTISIHNVNTEFAPTSLGSFFIGFDETSSEYVTWNGSESDEWNNSNNWTPNLQPIAALGVVIPNSANTVYDPTLPTNAQAKYILMGANSVLNTQTGSTLTLYGSGNAWSSEPGSVFNQGESTVTFNNTSADVNFSGSNTFHHLNIAAGVNFVTSENAYIGISGNLTVQGTASFSVHRNTVEYKGNSTQTVINPTGGVDGYHELILSGSGTKILPSRLDMLGDLTVNTSAVNASTNLTSLYLSGVVTSPHIQYIKGTNSVELTRLYVLNEMGVELQQNLSINTLLQMNLANPSDTKGLLHTGNYRLTLTPEATIDGVGDVTGYVKRTSFTTDTYYQMGHKDTKILFTGTPTDFPDSVVVKIAIGAAPSWKPNAIKRVYDFVQNGGVNCFATIRTHYLESELNGNIEGVLTQWTSDDNGQAPIIPIDWGKSNQSIADNWVEIVNVDIASFPTSFGNMENSLGPMSPPTNTWGGSISSDWNNPLNWNENIIPDSTSKVIIPNAATTTYDPMLPNATTEIKLMYIDNGGILNATTGTPTLVLHGGNEGSWTCHGTFNPGVSTVEFHSESSVYGGSTQFHHITFTTGTHITLTDAAYIGISGTATNLGTGTTIGRVTIEYNGTGDQTIINPNAELDSYDHLILSGSGTKTFPAATRMYIFGDLTISGTAVAQAIDTLTMYGNVTIDAGATFNLGTYTHHFAGNVTKNGTMNTSTGTVVMDGTTISQTLAGSSEIVFNNLTVNNPYGIILSKNIRVDGILNLQSNSPGVSTGTIHTGNYVLHLTGTTTGVGGVTGYAKRSALTAGNTYSFGNPYNSIHMDAGASADSIIIHLSQGNIPSWKSNAIKRTVSVKGHGTVGTADFSFHYRDAELNMNAETDLVFWSHTGETTTEYTVSGRDATNNYILMNDYDITTFPTTMFVTEFTLAASATNDKVWNGTVSTDWTVAENWTPSGAPVSTSNVKIPDATTTAFDPTFPASTTINTLNILTGGILNGGTATTVTIAGSENFMTIAGTFNAGTSKVIITNPSASVYSDINFYDWEIAEACTLNVNAEITVTISGTFTSLGNAQATGGFTFVYDGGNQNIAVPSQVNKRYFNVTFKGTGTKTMPATPLTIYGDFIVQDGVTVTMGAGLDFRGDLDIQNGTVNMGAYTHVLASDITNAGTISIPHLCNITLTGTFNNSGTLNHTGGVLNLNGPFNNTGIIDATGGTTYAKGNFYNAGTMSGGGSNHLVINGTSKQTFDGPSTSAFNIVTIDNSAGVAILNIGQVDVDSMIINSGKFLELSSRKILHVNRIINNAGATGIMLKSNYTAPNPTLIYNNAVENAIEGTVELATKGNLADGNYNWQFVGLPVAEFSKRNGVLAGSYMRQFNEAAVVDGVTVLSPWTPVSEVMQAFRGYMITQANPRIIPIAGTLNNQSKTFNLLYTAAPVPTYQGLNLLANSFTAAVNIPDLVFGAQVVNEVYLFNTGYRNTTQDPASVSGENAGVYLVVPKATAGTLGLPGQISSMQAFFVQASAASQTLEMPYTSAVNQTVSMRAPKAPVTEEFVGTRLTLHSARTMDHLWLFSHPACTNAFDNGFDGNKMMGGMPSAQMYVSMADRDYQVFTTNDYDMTDITFVPGADSVYTLRANHHRLDEKYPLGLYLVDLQENVVVNMTDENATYTFTANSADASSKRFRIVSDSSSWTSENELPVESVKIAVNDGKMIVLGGSGAMQLEVHDATGRMVYQDVLQGDGSRVVNHVFDRGTYVVKAVSATNRIVQKVIVK